ncbi:MAG: rhodanese-like domain-containing protein [Chitinophagales bacterium]
MFKSIFGSSTSNSEVKQYLEAGAAVIDVRTYGEFQGGHVAGSKNIPLNELGGRVNELKKMKRPLVLCCRSGARSGQAEMFLKKQGVDCVNGGSWLEVNGLVNN